MKPLLNFILFQVSWFACVLVAANSLPWLGVLVTFMVIFWHLYQSKIIQPELMLMFTVLVIGGLFDQALLELIWFNMSIMAGVAQWYQFGF